MPRANRKFHEIKTFVEANTSLKVRSVAPVGNVFVVIELGGLARIDGGTILDLADAFMLDPRELVIQPSPDRAGVNFLQVPWDAAVAAVAIQEEEDAARQAQAAA